MIRGLFGRVYLSVVVLVVVFAAYYIGFSLLASAKEKDVNEAWTKTLGGSFDLAAKFPRAKKNATAQVLEGMTKPETGLFGLKAPQLLQPWPGAWKTIDVELNKPANQPVNLSQQSKDYLNAHQKQFSIIYSQVRKELPQWETDFENVGHEPVANLATASAIVRLIALDALNKHQSGQTAAAQEAAEAGWKIDQALHNRPEMASQMLAANLDDVEDKLSRRMGKSSAQWQKQLESVDYEKAAQWCLAISAEHFSHQMSESPDLFFFFNHSYANFPGTGSKLGVVFTALARPYLRVCAANASEAFRHTVEACKSGKSGTNYIGWWNVPGKYSATDIRVIEKILARSQGKGDKV